MADENCRYYVYMHTFPDCSIYIGKGCGNRAVLFSKSRRSDLWLRVAKKYGMPDVTFLKSGICEELAFFIEYEAINSYREKGMVLLNIAQGGQGGQAGMIGSLSHNFGMKRTEEHKKMLSISHTGSGNPHHGKHHSHSAKAAISKNTKKSWLENYDLMRSLNKGSKHTEEHNAKIGAASKMMSPASREIIRIKNTGQKRTPEQLENYKRAGERRLGVKRSEESRKRMSDSQWRKDKTVYKFIGPDEVTYTLTRSEFKQKTGIEVFGLFRNGPKRQHTVKGWRIDKGDE
jgi:hypothetical protein